MADDADAAAARHHAAVLVAVHIGCGAAYGIAVVDLAAYIRPITFAGRSFLLPLVGLRVTGSDRKGSLRALGHRLACGLGGDAGGRDRCAAAQVARHGAAAGEDGAVVGQVIIAVELGAIRDSQALALADGEFILQHHRAVHGAVLVVKDDAAAIITRWCRRRKRYRSS